MPAPQIKQQKPAPKVKTAFDSDSESEEEGKEEPSMEKEESFVVEKSQENEDVSGESSSENDSSFEKIQEEEEGSVGKKVQFQDDLNEDDRQSEHNSSQRYEPQSQYGGVDLSVLYQNVKDKETIFRLTELYLPRSDDIKKRMKEYNRELMRTQNDDDSALIQESKNRQFKREVKKELKEARDKIRHQIKYCQVPTSTIDEAVFRYRPGMTGKDLKARSSNMYDKNSYIARIMPTKRPVTQVISQEQSMRLSQLMNKKLEKKENEIKYQWYINMKGEAISGSTSSLHPEPAEDISLMEIFGKFGQLEDGQGEFNLQKESAIADSILEEDFTTLESNPHDTTMALPGNFLQQDVAQVLSDSKVLELQYGELMVKIQKENLSLTDMSEHERKVIREYLKSQKNSILNSKYPQSLEKLSKVEKQTLAFMKHFKIEDFSYKDKRSLGKSDDMGGIVFDGWKSGANHQSSGNGFLGAGSAGPENSSHRHQISNLLSNDDRFSDAGINEKPLKRRDSEKEMQKYQEENNKVMNDSAYNGASEQQLKQWHANQKITQINPKQRHKYWGEPSDCSSSMQIERENLIFKKVQNSQYIQRGKRDEELFSVNKNVPQSNNAPQTNTSMMKPQRPQDKPIKPSGNGNQPCHPIKDLQEYEFIQGQKQNFYQNQSVNQNSIAQLRQLNGIVRAAKFALGDITAEEFYAQECLEEQIEEKENAALYGTLQKYQPSQKQTSSQPIRKDRAVPQWVGQAQQSTTSFNVDLNESFDDHFQRRKKELHDNMMKKIQLTEKQSQPNSANNQTMAYASGKDVLKIFSDSKMQNGAGALENFDGKPGDEKQLSQDVNMAEDNDGEEGIPAIKNQNTHHQHDITQDDNMRLRVTKSRANELNHAKCILKLNYTKFHLGEKELINFHRPNIHEIFLYARQLQQNANLRAQLPPSIPISVMTNEYIEKRSKKIGINAHEYFKDRFKLSLKDGKFSIFEHVDQRPLFVNNFGMASKLKRYVYSDGTQPLPPSEFTKKGNTGLSHMGPYGVQILKKKQERTPLLGQIDPKVYKGVTVLENNMYYCPVFYHKAPRNDFLCLMHQDKHGKSQIFVRELQDMYLMGQIEPKTNMEVYNPQSRQYHHFIKRRTQAYVIRFLQENERISFNELNKFFSYLNDQILKKMIKEIHVDVDRNQTCSLQQEYKDEQFRQLITPEQICQYESAQFGNQMLQKVGIRDITNADKISYATNKFCSEEINVKKQLIARIIEEEVLSTPWNLSQNFNHNRQQKGMMMLEGIGDPSNGHGGYSYLKLPLKISQDSLNKAKINRMFLNPAIQNPKAVTGTDADLRKLSKRDIHQKLINLGFNREVIEKFTRWEMVALLRDRSSQAVTQGVEGDNKKFARGVRFTSKKQKEMYQKQINDIFKKQINYLKSENPAIIQDVSDSEQRDQKQKRMIEIQNNNQNQSKNMVVLKDDIEVEKLQDIPDFEILVMNSITQGQAGAAQAGIGGIVSGIGGFQGFQDKEAAKKALKEKLSEGYTLACTILRKKIRPVDAKEEGGAQAATGEKGKIERVIFCSDFRQIKGFNKRKSKHEGKTNRTKKTSLKEKMQTQKSIFEGKSDLSTMQLEKRSDSQSIRGPSRTLREGNLNGEQNLNGQKTMQDTSISSQGIKIQITPQFYQGSQKTTQQNVQKLAQFAEPLKPQQSTLTFGKNSSIPSLASQSSIQNQGPSIDAPSKVTIPMTSTQSTIRLSIAQPDQFQNSQMPSQSTIQIPQQPNNQKISLNLSGGLSNIMIPQQPSFYEEHKKSSSRISLNQYGGAATSSYADYDNKKKKTLSTSTAQKESAPKHQKSSIAQLPDEEYEQNLYKPKTMISRRRQQSEESLLNQIFDNIIDFCIKSDKNKYFTFPVKKKDAPNYFETIREPMDLNQMKSKAKRQDYTSREQFERDLNLIAINAARYNGDFSDIAIIAKQIENIGLEKVEEYQNDIANYELLVQEKIQNGFVKMA